MYKVKDYLQNGMLYLNNIARPTAQETEPTDVILHHQLPVALQALFNMEKA
jgi:hypothetical protein